MSDHTEPFDGDETLHKDTIHRQNRENEQHMKDHENHHVDTGNSGAGKNPTHHGIGGR